MRSYSVGNLVVRAVFEFKNLQGESKSVAPIVDKHYFISLQDAEDRVTKLRDINPDTPVMAKISFNL